MRNLISLKDFNKEEILEIINLAEEFENETAMSKCFGKHLALLFFEDSST